MHYIVCPYIYSFAIINIKGFAQSNGLQIKVPILNPDPIQPTNIETTTLVKSNFVFNIC